jgi:hypothetical protein
MNLLNLGNDVIYTILSYIDDHYHQKAINKTCKTFHNIALILAKNNIWTSKIILSYIDYTVSVLFFKESTTLMMTDIEGTRLPSKLKDMTPYLTNIKTLTLRRIDMTTDLSRATNLATLSIHNDNINLSKMTLPSSITSLTIHCNDNIKGSLKYLTSLKSLTLSTNAAVNIDLPTSLKHLTISAHIIHEPMSKDLILDTLRVNNIKGRAGGLTNFYVGTLIKNNHSTLLNSYISTKDLL